MRQIPWFRLLPACLLLFTTPVWANNVEKRIYFKSGASSATVKGRWFKDSKARGETFDRYILGARKGQSMTLTLKATAAASIYVWVDDYNNGPNWGEVAAKSWTKKIVLPQNGDYNIDLGSAGNDLMADYDYTLTVEIR